MKLTYLKLKDDSVVINLPSGPHTINPYTVGYKQIIEALNSDIQLSEFLPLLSPKLPNGIFYAYDVNNELLVVVTTGESKSIKYLGGNSLASLPSNAIFLGAYASKEDLFTDYPEYLL